MLVTTRAPQCRIRFVTHRLGEFTADVVQSSRIDVTLHRQVGAAAGSFQIVMVPRLVGLTEGWEDAVQPMDFCFPAGTRVLTADLRWTGIEEIRPDDELLAVDESTGQGRGMSRRWRRSVVERVSSRPAAVVRYELADGTHLTVTPDHPVLAEIGNRIVWRPIQEVFDPSAEALSEPLARGRDQRACSTCGRPRDRHSHACRTCYLAAYAKPRNVWKVADPWSFDASHDAGWMAGFLDGEGTLSSVRGSGLTLSASQNDGDVQDRLRAWLENHGFKFGVYRHVPRVPPGRGICKQVGILGRFADRLRLIGSTRPTRLLGRFQELLDTHDWKVAGQPIAILSATPLAEPQEVYNLQTSTRTYVAEGFAVHNCEISLWVPPREPLVVMRGFVDAVATQFSIGGGSPQRGVVIAGRDYGKLALITKAYTIEALVSRDPAQVEVFRDWLAGFRMVYGRQENAAYRPERAALRAEAVNTKLPPTGQKPAENIEAILEGFLRPQEAAVRAGFPDNEPPEIRFLNQVEAEDDEPLRALNPAFYARNYDPFMDVWTMFRSYQHAPWRELFFDDYPDFPALVYRLAPWLDVDGGTVQTPSAGAVELAWPLTREDLIEFSLARTDEEVRNYFFTYPALFPALPGIVKEIPRAAEGFMKEPLQGNPYLVGFSDGEAPESDFRRHGFRLLEVKTPYFDVERHVPEAVVNARILERAEPARRENLKLKRAFDHGALLERGAITVKGDERIHAGDYVKVQDALYYAEGLTHRYRQGTQAQDGHFITGLQVTRGRGHLERRQNRRGPL